MSQFSSKGKYDDEENLKNKQGSSKTKYNRQEDDDDDDIVAMMDRMNK